MNRARFIKQNTSQDTELLTVLEGLSKSIRIPITFF